MQKDALEYLKQELGTTVVLDIGGRQYTNRQVHEVEAPTAPTLEVVSLNAMVQYLKGNLDLLADQPLMAQVKSPTRVELYGATFGDFRQRDTYMVADCAGVLPKVVFGGFLSQEEFVIMLASGFVNADALAMVRVGGKPTLVRKPQRREDAKGSITYENPGDITMEEGSLLADLGDLEYCAEVATSLVDKDEAVHQDDGLAQTVTLKSGSGSLARVELKEIVNLRPYRTFADVMQPMSMFKLRVRRNGGLALFEADGGRWRLEAMDNVRHELEFRLAEAGVNNVTVIA